MAPKLSYVNGRLNLALDQQRPVLFVISVNPCIRQTVPGAIVCPRHRKTGQSLLHDAKATRGDGTWREPSSEFPQQIAVLMKATG